mgnify:CR=1 FL=1
MKMILKDCHINRNMIKEFENFIPEETAKLLYEESKTIPKNTGHLLLELVVIWKSAMI